MIRLTLIVASLTMLPQTVLPQVELECVFTTRSSMTEVIKLANHTYKLERDAGQLTLSQRTANGSWMHWATMTKAKAGQFVVFLHLPPEGDLPGAVHLLTVHQSGTASLATHFGGWGNQHQYRRAWLQQGHCQTPS